jgi:hypothetical protein
MYGLGQPLDNLILKTERAKKHVLDLEAEFERFMQTKPNTFAFKTDANTSDRIYYVTKVTPVPVEFSLLIGDALNNIRSALDHLAYQLVSVGGGTGEILRQAKFPIGNSPSDYIAQKSGIVPGLRQDAIKAIDAIEPYETGVGGYLCHLAALNNFDKHRLLVPVWGCISGHTAFPSEKEFLAKFYRKDASHFSSAMMVNKRAFPTKAGDVILTVPKADVEENMQFLFNITFGKPEIAKGNPVIETLHEMTKMVRNIIFDFDKYGCFR